jgi:integrase
VRGHVRKRGNGWCFVFDAPRTGGGARQQKWRGGFRTRRDAERALAEALSQQAKGTLVEPSKQTVGDFAREWMDTHRSSWRASTWQSYWTNVEAHIIPQLGLIRLQNLTPQALNHFYAFLLREGRRDGRGGLSAGTVRYCHILVHRALADAVRWGRLQRNVADLADPPRKQARAPHEVWDAPQLRKFLAYVERDRLYPAWVLAAMTGMRRGEVLGLRWSDVDLDNRRVAVRQTLILVNNRLQFSVPKTPKSRRSVAVDAETADLLRRHWEMQARERAMFGDDYQDMDLVFAREDGRPLRPEAFSKAFKEWARAADVPGIRLHHLRHTYATLALSDEHPPQGGQRAPRALEHQHHARHLLARCAGHGGRGRDQGREGHPRHRC